MKPSFSIYRHLPRHDTRGASAVTIGNFDGVHRGHQTILRRVVHEAAQRDIAPTVMTFQPHPRAFFAQRGQRPELVPTQISSLRDKAWAMQRLQIRQLVLQRFNQQLADMPAEDFIEKLLVQGLQTRWLLVGEDFRYGHKRMGDVALLRRAGQRHGFEVETLSDVVDEHGYRISSSEVRTALAVGNLERAERLLGHTYRISGHVIHGQKLGRTLGYPTLNIRVPSLCAARSGVYVVRAHGLDEQPLNGVASLGVRPTISDTGRIMLEVHLLDRRVDAYGKLTQIEFLQYLRDEEKFPDLPTMIAAIDNDAQSARDYFALHGL
ncbi:bifunctional riboflavin kinase/FAD synthetase [Pusillimonas noertemannii]|uniref:Riboflavin biosynthesis protein n=1 Tax=Pusillimonas noertemannii TaxID=305977 RepID=A0A2U1CJD7_9BURK|nr:bifunctional riboflavin kinase/FAD synthetase [Pusillimonas noertemannii]NYT70148.1 bifunctional riboflavin kinase/FAD synthetase [Pusillimonas noertemannii]PVY61094.1 FMN adenylyltransferase /riboflavin kinase [Pusillimonas noertemannii]TFL08254.1 bifunctional riboflavin kinase/FAD synthetase [Pusillimonas noertemannii]